MLEKSKVEEAKQPTRSIEDLIKEKDYQALSEHLTDGIKDYLQSDTFQTYLNFISSFHHYSFKNVQLILSQNIEATHVAGFQSWKKRERWVKKGEKAIYVYAPSVRDKKDKEGNLVTNEDGEVEQEIRFFLTPVFDVRQTDGKEAIPEPVYPLMKNLDDPKKFTQTYQALVELSPVEVKIEPIVGKANGYYDPTKKEIVLRQGMGEVMTLKVLLHEITHALLHSNSSATFGDKVYRQQEFEAESVAYVVSRHLGMDTSDYSFGYLSSWTDQGKDLMKLEESLKRITNQAKQLIDDIDVALDKVMTLEAPRNKFEERVAIARNRPIAEPRQPKKEYQQEEVKQEKSSKEKSLANRLRAVGKTSN